MKRELELVVTHLDMALYGYKATAQAELHAQFGDQIPYLYHMFASVNLLSSLFLIREKSDPEDMAGYIYRVVHKFGLGDLCTPINKILSAKIGATTFGDIIRITRNKLMVHGDLALESLPSVVASVTLDEESMAKWEELMGVFVGELVSLRRSIQNAIQSL